MLDRGMSLLLGQARSTGGDAMSLEEDRSCHPGLEWECGDPASAQQSVMGGPEVGTSLTWSFIRAGGVTSFGPCACCCCCAISVAVMELILRACCWASW